jgi:hypothetical protein
VSCGSFDLHLRSRLPRYGPAVPEFEGDPGTAYVETRRRGIYRELPDGVRDYREAFNRLQLQALHPEETPGAIAQAAKDIR